MVVYSKLYLLARWATAQWWWWLCCSGGGGSSGGGGILWLVVAQFLLGGGGELGATWNFVIGHRYKTILYSEAFGIR